MGKKDFLIICLFLALLLCVVMLRVQYKKKQNLEAFEREMTEKIISENSESSGGVFSASEKDAIHLGYLCAEREDFDCLIKESTKAIEITPNSAMAYNNRAYGYLRLNKLELAENDIITALQLEPYHTLALNNRGLLLIKQGKFDSALIDVEKAQANDSSIPEIYLNKGMIYAGKKQYLIALEEFDKAIRMNPDLAIAYEERSNIFKLLGEFDKAEVDKLKAKEIREYR